MRKTIVLLFLALLAAQCTAATIQGSLFDWETLGRIDNAIIDVNSIPPQRVVAENALYSFDVLPGTYLITAMEFVEGKLAGITREIVIVENEGLFNLDLVLKQATEQDIKSLEERGLETELFEKNQLIETLGFAAGFAIAFAIAFTAVFLLFRRKKKAAQIKMSEKKQAWEEKQTLEEEKQPEQERMEPGRDKYAKEVLDVLKKSGNRLTQKELREKCRLCGEAKISLILTELEDMGKIKKIKKGRGNVIILIDALP